MKLTMKLVALGLALLPLTLARGATYNYNLIAVLSGSTMWVLDDDHVNISGVSYGPLLDVFDGGTLNINDSGQVTVSGSIAVVTFPLFSVSGVVNLGGDGRLVVSGTSDWAAQGNIWNAADITANGSLTVSGNGYWENNGTLRLDGGLTVTDSGSAVINGVINPGSGFNNSRVNIGRDGRLTVNTAAYIMQLSVSGNGVFESDSLSFYNGTGPAEISVTGSGRLTTGYLSMDRYSGNGAVSVTVSDSGYLEVGGLRIGAYAPVAHALTITGSATVSGNYSQASAAVLTLGLGGAPALDIRGIAYLGSLASNLTGPDDNRDVGGANLRVNLGGSGLGGLRASELGSVSLLHADGGIYGRFTDISVLGAAPDYLNIGGVTRTATDYLLDIGLKYFSQNDAAFTFTTSGETFDVDVPLTDNGATWSINKLGAGALILSASNSYTGGIYVAGGTLVVTGQVGGESGYIDTYGPERAVAIVSGNGRWETKIFAVGDVGAGALTITDAARVVAGEAYLGFANVGAATVSGGGWWQSGSLGVGGSGTGSLIITDSGSVSAGELRLGVNTGGDGTVSVSGNGFLNVTEKLVVGFEGAGDLSITGNASVISAYAWIGDYGTGSVSVSDQGFWQTDWLTVGNYGNGNLTITDSGSVSVNYLALGGGIGVGTVSVNGNGSLGVTDFLHVGSFDDTSALTISGSGSVMVGGEYSQGANSTLNIALDPDRVTAYLTAREINLDGTLTVSGFSGVAPAKASALTDRRFLILQTTNGISGDFDSVSDGAASDRDYLRVTGAIDANNYYVGLNLAWFDPLNSSGVFTTSGETFDVDVPLTGDLDLSKRGEGTVILSANNSYSGMTFVQGGTLVITASTGGDTGFVDATDDLPAAVIVSGSGVWETAYGIYIADSGSGSLTVTDSARVISPGVMVGDYGAGALTVSGSGRVSVGELWLGASTGGVGTVSVGDHGFLNVTENLVVGFDGTGGLNITGSARVISADAWIGDYGTGTVSVSGNGFWQTDWLTVGNNGSGNLAITDSGSVAVGYLALGGDTGVGTASVGGNGSLSVTTDLWVGGFGSDATGALTISGSVTVGGDYIQGESSTLNIALDPDRATAYLTARSANLAGALTVSVFGGTAPVKASAVNDRLFLLVQTEEDIYSDFDYNEATGGSVSDRDYLKAYGWTESEDYQHYYAHLQLTWFDPYDRDGVFTTSGETFDVDVPLTTVEGGFHSGWDGNSLTKAGAGTLTLSATNTYTGATTVSGGVLRLATANAIAASKSVSVASGATLSLGGYDQNLGALHNNGLVDFVNLGRKLTVHGDLTGSGAFRMDTDIAAGRADTLDVQGTVSGAHELRITNTGAAPTGEEAPLLLVTTQGGDGSFDGAVTAGFYDYAVENGATLGEDTNNWYLNLSGTNTDNGADNGGGQPPTVSVTGAVHGSALAVKQSMWFAQQNSLVKRMGDIRLREEAAAPERKLDDKTVATVSESLLGNIWVRGYGQQLDMSARVVGRSYQQYIYGTDLGTDLRWTLDNNNTLYTGLYAGYGRTDLDYRAADTDGTVNSYYGGLYATWLNHSGFYIDVTVKAASVDHELKDGTASANFDDLNLGGSIELGKKFTFADGWFIEPQAQANYLHNFATAYRAGA
ncbi:MAG: autotransporter outer membrane beta-barrel domain-containing protein, partial [Verrucomicrobiales bacterium]|nr:autotransporter outer membrane beta-barrel domain-containing protein [Verrucomicrobiales bacterium]